MWLTKNRGRFSGSANGTPTSEYYSDASATCTNLPSAHYTKFFLCYLLIYLKHTICCLDEICGECYHNYELLANKIA